MANNQAKKILILGGYGRAGMEIAKLMAAQGNYTILIGGRTISKAEHAVKQLKINYQGINFEAVDIDINEKKTVREKIPNADLIIVALPLSYENTLILIDAILQSSNTHYIDLSPSGDKYRAFSDRSEQIDKGNQTFILDAGFEPGLPGFMARWALSESEQPEELVIEGIYRDPDIPKGGVKDILSHNEPAFKLDNGSLKKAATFEMKMTDFPFGFGKALTVPIWMPELQSIPSKFNLKNMVYYHGGINSLANFIMIGWQMVFNKFLPIHIGINLFKWAIRNFTKKPYGGVIRVTVKSFYQKKEFVLSHNELYKATAIPILATSKQLLNSDNKTGGKFFMGEFVNIEKFLELVEQMGMKIQKT